MWRRNNYNFLVLIVITFVTVILLPSYCMEQYKLPLSISIDQDDNETELEEVSEVETVSFNQTTAVANFYDIFSSEKDDKASTKGHKVTCLKNVTNLSVEIVNSTGLNAILYMNPAVKSRTTASNCSLIFFYARWCPFSANAAPHFNAIPRVFPYIKTAAIDATVYSSVNTYFGILSVPTVMLFHNGKLTAKFNDTTYNLAKFGEFITTYTDLEPEEKLNVTSTDFQGPLPSTQSKEIDPYLYLAWIFIIICFLNYARKSTYFKVVVEFIRVTWREAEAQREHQD